MIEGGSTKDFTQIKQLAWNQPVVFEKLMHKLSKAIIDYAHMQIDAGADALQIFDSWAAICPSTKYQSWSLRWIGGIINALKCRVPVILFAKGMGHRTDQLINTGASILSIDWTTNLADIRKRIGTRVAVQGNLDPAVLTTTPEITHSEAKRILSENDSRPGFIFNLGHGMLPEAKVECVETLMQTVTGKNV